MATNRKSEQQSGEQVDVLDDQAQEQMTDHFAEAVDEVAPGLGTVLKLLKAEAELREEIAAEPVPAVIPPQRHRQRGI